MPIYATPKWLDPPLGTPAVSGGWEFPQPVSLPIFDSPIEVTTKQYIFTQDWMVLRNNFSALALNTTHADYPTFFLVDEGPAQDLGAGVTKWTRTYAIKPDSYSLYERYGVTFPGWGGVLGNSTGSSTPTGRVSFNEPANTRMLHEFFLVGPNLGITPDYADAGSIPIIQAQKWRISNVLAIPAGWWFDDQALVDSPPFAKATTPSSTDYHNWIKNALNKSWASDTIAYNWGVPNAMVGAISPPVAFPGQWCVEDSTIALWHGNIYERVTRFVLAK